MNGRRRSGPLHLALVAAVVAAIAWGALAFGAVYPWAFTPLAIGCACVGIAALVAGSRDRPPLGALAIGLVAIGLAIGLQLVPVPPAALARISPAADLLATAPGAAADEPLHPISIAPDRTVVGLGLFTAFALFLLGCSRLTSVLGARLLAGCAVGFGVFLAVVGIGGYALSVGDAHPVIYGFWKPLEGARPFGPFVNPNHFAGWMLMAIPLALALVVDVVMRAIDRAPGSTTDRLGWVNSGQFGVLLLATGAYVVMGLSLLMTRSRSALFAFAIGTAALGFVVARRQKNSVRAFGIAAGFVALLFGAAAWAGLDNIVGKFAETDKGLTFVGGRWGVWKDTLEIARQFPLTGTGVDTYGVAMMVYQSGSRAVQFQEAHNDYLQLAAEGGLLVGLPVLATLAIFIRDVRRRFQEAPKEGATYWLRVGAVVGLLSIALQSLVEFSLQMPGNAALFAVIAAIALHQSPNLRTASRRPRESE